MYKIVFYQNEKGISEVKNYIDELNENHDNKDNRVKLKKTTTYIDLLSEEGLSLGMPYIKHIEGDIWELRPLRDRILFANFDNNKFILLNCFIKKTQKTPKKEIEKAKRLLKEYIRRQSKNE